MSKIITQEEFENMVKINNPYTIVIGEYSGMRNKVECQCLVCNERYYATAYDVKIGKIHKPCASRIASSKKRKTHEQFVQEVTQIFPNITISGEYVNAKTKISCHCNIHNTDFLSDPDHLLSGKSGCPACRSEKISAALIKSSDDFVKDLQKVTDDIEVIEPYKGSHRTIGVKCKICGFMWQPIAGSLLAGNGCPHCSGRYKTTEEFRNEIYKYNQFIEIVGEYYNSQTKILCKCKKCNNMWYANPSNLKISGCPVCNMSHGEKSIKKYLDDIGLEYIYQKSFENLLGVKGGKLSYDFYIPDLNILIEYQGEFHDGTARQQSCDDYMIQLEHDKRKRQYALNNNYKLIEIWYFDYNNINEILEREIC